MRRGRRNEGSILHRYRWRAAINSPQIFMVEGWMIGGAEEIFVYTREDAKLLILHLPRGWPCVQPNRRTNRTPILAASAAGIFPTLSKRRRIFSTPPFANYAIPLIALLIARPLQHLHRATPSAQALFHSRCCYTLRSSSTTSFDPRHQLLHRDSTR